MTPLQQAEKRIRELVPSLQELSFGCEVIKSEIHRGSVIGEAYSQVAYVHYDNVQVYLAPKEDFQILGHPIQLHHVLQAIEKVDKWYQPDLRGTGKDSNPILYILKGNMSIGSTKWNLKLPLSGQSEETINFLLEILN